ncbi:MAG: hypothetical protein N3G20_10710, partial [Verrucomicrobiae bacterium]|nr:hypothetical protein [Verrucomicrobiae bacterium]
PPLNFNDLALPPPGLQGDDLRTYRASAQLFVGSLLSLPHGKDAMVQMLLLLRKRLNWQTAFLEAYRLHFPTLLAVEQWWALVTVRFLCGTEPHSWSLELTRRKLDDVLRVAVARSAGPGQPPSRTTIPLQEVIRETPYRFHRDLIRVRLSQLQLLQYHSAPEFVPLIEQYVSTLREYLAQSGSVHVGTPGARPTLATAGPTARETILKLNELDRKRSMFIQAPPGPTPPPDRSTTTENR